MKNQNQTESRLSEGAMASQTQATQDRPCCRDRCTAAAEAVRCRKDPVTLSNAQAHDALRYLRYERGNILATINNCKPPSEAPSIWKRDLEEITSLITTLENQV